MPDSAVPYVFIAGLCVFFLSSILALIFSKKYELNKLITYISTITASSAFIYISVMKLCFRTDETISFKISSSFDFISLHFTIDNLSAFFILLVSFLSLIVSIYSLGYVKHYENKRNTGLLGALYNLFICSMLLVVTSGQLFFFLVSWEIMSLVSYFLVVYENEKPEAQKAGIIYLVMTHIGTAFITVGFILLYKYSGQSVISLIDVSLVPASVKNIIFLMFLLGFGAKAGIVPLHIWLPYAHPSAPSNVSALMSGVMIKTAVYGILRFVLGTLSAETRWWGLVILSVGAVSIVFGIICALMEKNIKRLLAYSSIENMGIIFIGIGLSISAASYGYMLISALSITAALFHAFNHSIFKGLLFLGAGSIHYATGTKDSEKLGGLIKKMPLTAIFFLTGSMSICALPPFNGFVSEWLTYQAMLLNIAAAGNLVKLVILISGALLALAGALAVYTFVKVYGISFLALPRSEHSANAAEVNRPMLSAMGILSAACVLLGLFPMFFIKLLEPVIHELSNTSIANEVSGFSSFLTYPVQVNNTSISPLVLLFVALLLFAVLLLVLLVLFPKMKIRKYVTWDCGFESLDSKMQYSATGFSKPARIVFRSILKPQRELKVLEGKKPYSISAAKYTVSTISIFEKYFYDPVIKIIMRFARKTRFVIQTGSIHTYLLYIFITILLMFVYFALSVG